MALHNDCVRSTACTLARGKNVQHTYTYIYILYMYMYMYVYIIYIDDAEQIIMVGQRTKVRLFARYACSF